MAKQHSSSARLDLCVIYVIAVSVRFMSGDIFKLLNCLVDNQRRNVDISTGSALSAGNGLDTRPPVRLSAEVFRFQVTKSRTNFKLISRPKKNMQILRCEDDVSSLESQVYLYTGWRHW